MSQASDPELSVSMIWTLKVVAKALALNSQCAGITTASVSLVALAELMQGSGSKPEHDRHKTGDHRSRFKNSSRNVCVTFKDAIMLIFLPCDPILHYPVCVCVCVCMCVLVNVYVSMYM